MAPPLASAHLILDRITEGVIGVDELGCVNYMNLTAERLIGQSLAQARGKELDQLLLLHEEDAGEEPVTDLLKPYLAGVPVMMPPRQCVLKRGQAQDLVIELTASPVLGAEGGIDGAIVVFSDITEMRSLEKQMAYQTSHDALTGLINRREFEARIHQAIIDAKQNKQEYALVILDLDRFKVINDTCGHVAGDVLLKQVTALLYATLRNDYSFILARLGGDEFGILLQYCGTACAREVSERLCREMQAFRFQWFENKYEMGASIGVSLISEYTRNHAEVLSAAESSCLLAKDRGRRRVHVYHPDDAELLQRRGDMQWLHRIRHALEKNQFCLYHQKIHPLIDNRPLPAQSEVLVRMIDERGKIVPPEAFIMAAERYQLMPEVDRWVINHAFDILGKRASRGKAQQRFYINLSGQSIGNENFLDYVVERTGSRGIRPQQICFEVTETAAIDNFSCAVQFIRVLREMGYHFALDDFGSGMSSYGYLKQLPVDFLKIDGSFVRDMLQDDTNQALVESINHMGHVMGVETIAEFVEDDATLQRLWEMGVDHVQGYGISRPTPLWQSLNTTRH